MNKMALAVFVVDQNSITFECERLDLDYAMKTANIYFQAILGQGKWEDDQRAPIAKKVWVRGNFFD